MARYRVMEAKCGVGAGGMACGPVAGPVVGEIKLADEDGDGFYLCLAEVDGIPNWFKTDRSTIDEQLSDEDEDDLEDPMLNNHQSNGHQSTTARKAPKSSTPVLDNFGTDLTQAAAEGKLDPVVGREREIERVTEILGRRKKNNPVLIGEPGVGKSAIVEGLAQLIVKKRTSPILFNKRLINLDMTSIVAGTK